jgi:hypothetical protein
VVEAGARAVGLDGFHVVEPRHGQHGRPGHSLAELLQHRGGDLAEPVGVIKAAAPLHDMARQECAVGQPLPYQAIGSQRVQNADQRALRDAGLPVQVVQAGRANLVQDRKDLQPSVQRANRLDLVIAHQRPALAHQDFTW